MNSSHDFGGCFYHYIDVFDLTRGGLCLGRITPCNLLLSMILCAQGSRPPPAVHRVDQ